MIPPPVLVVLVGPRAGLRMTDENNENRMRYGIEEHKTKLTEYSLVRFGVFAAVTMKNAVFWDIKNQFVLHRRHITSPLQSPAS
jgi:hypothetical protein